MNSSRNENLSELRRQIVNHFDKDELSMLAFELAVNWDDLSGDKVSMKAHSLILLLDRQNRLNELQQILDKERPHTAWIEISKGETLDHSPPLEATPVEQDPLRTAVWNALYKSLWTKKTFLNSHKGKPPLIDKFSIALWDYLNLPIDSRPQEPKQILAEIRYQLFSQEDAKFLPLLEFILHYWNDLRHYSPNPINYAVNQAFQRQGADLKYVITTHYNRFESGSIVSIDEPDK